jgi:hypothetical protein
VIEDVDLLRQVASRTSSSLSAAGPRYRACVWISRRLSFLDIRNTMAMDHITIVVSTTTCFDDFAYTYPPHNDDLHVSVLSDEMQHR